VADADRSYDVACIMAEIRALNSAERERGVFTDEELEQIARQRFRSFADEAHIDPRLLDRFLDPGHDWNIATDYIIRTHRKGLVAQLSLVGKRIVRPLVRLYTDHLLDRQTQINQYFCHLLHGSIREIVRLEMKVKALEARCRDLERAAGGRP
jgi:hypothetical protein